MARKQAFVKTVYSNGEALNTQHHATLREAQMFAGMCVYDNGVIRDKRDAKALAAGLKPGGEIEAGRIRITLEKVEA